MTEAPNASRWQSIRRAAVDVAFIIGVVVLAYTALVRPIPPPPPPPPPAGETGSVPPTRPVVAVPADPIPLEGAIVHGSPSARVALVEYTDLECPYCGKFARETLPALDRKFIATGKVLFVFRHLLLPRHEFAPKAAEAVECADKQGKFWTMHAALFRSAPRLAESDLQAGAQSAGLNVAEFEECLNGAMTAKVIADSESARELGVTGTPTFFVGPVIAGNRVKVVRRFSGAQPVAVLERILESLVTQNPPTSEGRR